MSRARVKCRVFVDFDGTIAPVDTTDPCSSEVGGRTYGLVLDIGGYHKNVITLAPNLHISRQEMDLSLQLLDRVLHRVSKE